MSSTTWCLNKANYDKLLNLSSTATTVHCNLPQYTSHASHLHWQGPWKLTYLRHEASGTALCSVDSHTSTSRAGKAKWTLKIQSYSLEIPWPIHNPVCSLHWYSLVQFDVIQPGEYNIHVMRLNTGSKGACTLYLLVYGLSSIEQRVGARWRFICMQYVLSPLVFWEKGGACICIKSLWGVSVFTFVCVVLASLCSLYTGNKLASLPSRLSPHTLSLQWRQQTR